MKMKRIAAISVSVMLSAIIIVLGAGIPFVHCNHSHTTELVKLSDIGRHDNAAGAGCCGHKDKGGGNGHEICGADCMETFVVRLASMASLCQHYVAFHAVCLPLHPFTGMTGRPCPPITVKPGARHTADAPHSPPRDYLRLIRILII